MFPRNSFSGDTDYFLPPFADMSPVPPPPHSLNNRNRVVPFFSNLILVLPYTLRPKSPGQFLGCGSWVPALLTVKGCGSWVPALLTLGVSSATTSAPSWSRIRIARKCASCPSVWPDPASSSESGFPSPSSQKPLHTLSRRTNTFPTVSPTDTMCTRISPPPTLALSPSPHQHSFLYVPPRYIFPLSLALFSIKIKQFSGDTGLMVFKLNFI
jgi:hypothetical protein